MQLSICGKRGETRAFCERYRRDIGAMVAVADLPLALKKGCFVGIPLGVSGPAG
jgi:hypothetical protein